jgi:hypothetical protein
LQSFWDVSHKDAYTEDQIGDYISAIGKVYEEKDNTKTYSYHSHHFDEAVDFLGDQCFTTVS